MILGIGTDLAHVPRLEGAWVRHGERFERHILTALERAELRRLPEPARPRFLARRWAAKEALAKAMGSGFGRGLHACLIGVTHYAAGAPAFELEGSAVGRLAALGAPHAHLSISDDGDYALAFVVLESGRGRPEQA